ncbi:helix-turn-helix domain-containing protein [Salmonella bongori]|uniref:helix-turn-helix transcriptional regulator n=1 Tax=Salmonella bongori TaxID=54736 RepID=UPI0012842280|nr:helix-turn-helix transcriptional regulator [Salmonella bongori]ECG8259814.1 XRE family transcriptional regulator [Salmonella bongori serovar 48:i:-]ECG9253336.1 helix-turn-helix domain-containing protein [Salmonella bongori]EDP8671034.1 helix-turn-helix domain-containing protein [Salmonella bongori]EDP8705711.1 helix-turn-helix domain-containing protein [Salmonella bongori]EDP8723501.1 helix-turn-helix domain-containing protein [Salmonella bongori]
MTKKVNLSTVSGADVSTINEAVSQRIKQFRRQKKMSLDELARCSGVSKGMLVEIEGCKANPSIALLCKIAAAMGVAVADIVNVASEPRVHLIDRNDIAVLWRGEKGGSAKLMAGTSGPDMVELWQWVMHPGEKYASEGHPVGTCELLFVNRGTLMLTVDDSRFIIGEGCSAVARTDMPHAYLNDTHEVVEFTMTVSEKHR